MPETAVKEKKRFRLLGGIHQEGSYRNGTSKVYEKGDIIESDLDLDKKFVNKFQRIYGDEPTDGLDDMTKDQLLKVAEEEEIEIPNNMSKPRIIEAIRLANK